MWGFLGGGQTQAALPVRCTDASLFVCSFPVTRGITTSEEQWTDYSWKRCHCAHPAGQNHLLPKHIICLPQVCCLLYLPSLPQCLAVWPSARNFASPCPIFHT